MREGPTDRNLGAMRQIDSDRWMGAATNESTPRAEEPVVRQADYLAVMMGCPRRFCCQQLSFD
jgi:hypothetical protein